MLELTLRESGMPDVSMWEGFFDPYAIFEQFELKDLDVPGADLFCGFGTFSIPLAKINKGTIYAVDINNEYVSHLEKRMQENNLTNIKIVFSDISDPGFQLPEKVDYVLLFNILHCEHCELLLENIIRNLTDDGKIFVIHWRSDIKTPRGPPLAIRPKIEDIVSLMSKFDFQPEKIIKEISPFHYGISFSKKPSFKSLQKSARF